MGLVALKVGILLAYLGFRFIGQPADHKVAFWLVVAFLVAWLIAVIMVQPVMFTEILIANRRRSA